jgi:Tfp pilus tip-associated adhesin PilY1
MLYTRFGPLIDIIESGIVAMTKAVTIATIFNEPVEVAILYVFFKKTTENNTRREWMVL